MQNPEPKKRPSTSSVICILCLVGCLLLGLTSVIITNRTAKAIQEIPFKSNVEVVEFQPSSGRSMEMLKTTEALLTITVKDGKFVQGEGKEVFILGESCSAVLTAPTEVGKFEVYPEDHVTTFVVNDQRYRASIFSSDTMQDVDGSLKQWANADGENVVLYGDKRLNDYEYLVISAALSEKDEEQLAAIEKTMSEMLDTVQLRSQIDFDLPNELAEVIKVPVTYINNSIISMENGDLLGVETCSDADVSAVKRLYSCEENEWASMKNSGIEHGYVYLTSGLRYSFFTKE